jgi:predicted nucleic acid-binding protein
MIFLVDTNVLVRLIQQSHAMHTDARRAATTLTRQGNQVSIIAQNLIEFWAVATRPTVNNGLALSTADTAAHIKTFQQTFTLLPDTPQIFVEWQRLVEAHSVSGRQAHDTRLVAAMLAHNATHLLTFNEADFKRYGEITVVNPQAISEEETK